MSTTFLPPRLADYWLTVARRTWKGTVVSSFVVPLLYIVAMGVLLGGFIHRGPAQLDGASSYLAFVAPGMVAAQSMTTVFGEVTYPVMGMVKWHRTYFGMIATPLKPSDVVLAHLGFVTFRVGLVSGVFLLVMSPFGVFESAGGVLVAWLVQMLIGLAFAAPIYGISVGLQNDSVFALIFRLGMIPLFLFSGAFFPVSNLGPALEWFARITPLWHGVDLTRMLVLGNVDGTAAVAHRVYLGVLGGLGTGWAVRRLTRRLIT
jgi:lipooligosaccharide transport system permease protein